MKPDRSDQVVARVVAWHNRHPLAQRITAAQVHSVGVVLLPFAVRGAVREGLPAGAPSAIEPELGPVVVAPTSDALSFAGLGQGEGGEGRGNAGEAAASGVGGAAGAGDLDSAPPPADTDAFRAATSSPAPAAEEREPPGAQASTGAGADEDAGAAPRPDAHPDARLDAQSLPVLQTPLSLAAVRLPPRPRRWDPRALWDALRGRPRFKALFSEDFIAPLRPRQVARWVGRHGVSVRPLEDLAPERVIELDPTRRGAAVDAEAVDLQVITAAIGVGDRRLRLLLAPGPRGAVLGPRAISLPRAAVAGGLAAMLLAGGMVGTMLRGHPQGEHTLAHAAPTASAPGMAASVASVADAAHGSEVAAQGASAPLRVAQVAASAAMAGAPAGHGDWAAHPRPASASAAAASGKAPHGAAASGETPHATSASGETPHAAPRAEAPAVAVAASRPSSVAPRRGRVEIEPLVPRLGDAERQDLRVAGRTLRGQPEVPLDAKAWALATPASADRRQMERAAAQLHALALLQPVPMRAELLRTGGNWRAVCWPFPTAADAEKVRLALADRGLRTEVVEF